MEKRGYCSDGVASRHAEEILDHILSPADSATVFQTLLIADTLLLPGHEERDEPSLPAV
jgi:hypothetical protein